MVYALLHVTNRDLGHRCCPEGRGSLMAGKLGWVCAGFLLLLLLISLNISRSGSGVSRDTMSQWSPLQPKPPPVELVEEVAALRQRVLHLEACLGAKLVEPTTQSGARNTKREARDSRVTDDRSDTGSAPSKQRRQVMVHSCGGGGVLGCACRLPT